MNKYQVTISFLIDDTFMKLLPAHREYINTLIEQGIIDHYIVTMESQQAWITINAPSKEEVILQLEKTPVYPYLTCRVEEAILYDGVNYRLPQVQLN